MMKKANTALLPGILSNISQDKRVITLLEVMVLFFLGMIAMVLHVKLRIPLQLPGRQGLLFLAIIVAGRLASKNPVSGSIGFMGAAATMYIPGLGFHDPFLPVIYLLCGFCLDGFFRLAGENAGKIFVIALMTGLCWMIIPLSRSFVVLFTGVVENSFRHGLAWPVLSHFIFGILGGMFGFSLVKIGESLKSRKA